MNPISTRVRAYFLLLVMFFNVSGAAWAANTPSPSSAFSSLLGSVDISSTSPGFYQSQARGVFSAGGVSIRFPRKSVQLISITPPSIQSGCGGISVFFGGFSFISGAEFSALIKNIAQVALGYVLHLALKTICPQCEAVLQLMQKLANMANKLGMDACAIGTKIGSEIGNYLTEKGVLDPSKQAQKNFCQNEAARDATTDGFLDSMSNACATFGSYVDKFNSWVDSGPGGDEKRAESAGLFGNSTWIALDNLGFKDDVATKELLMAMIGTVITIVDPADPAKKKALSDYKSPIAGSVPDEMMDMFMCGSTDGFGNDISEEYCANRTRPRHLKMYLCTDTVKCEAVTEIPYQEWLVKRGWDSGGFMYAVAEGLTIAVNKVAAGQAIPDPSLQLMNSAPFPLYKVVNIAAVYPDLAHSLVANHVEIIAGLLAQRYFMDLVQAMGKRKNLTALPPSMAQEIRKMLMAVRDRVELKTARTLEFMTLQTKLMADVQTINKNIQDNLIPQGILGNQSFGSNVGMYKKN